MDYKKIIELAHACDINQNQINQCRQILGISSVSDEFKLSIHNRIKQLDSKQLSLNNKLRKLIEDK